MADKANKGKKRKWTEVSIENPLFFSGNVEGFVSLEECHDYTMENDGESSRVVEVNENKTEKVEKTEQEQPKKKRKRKKKKKKAKTSNETGDNRQEGECKKELTDTGPKEMEDGDEKKVQEPSSNMSGWGGLGVPTEVLKALSELGFTQPTAIQALAIPPAVFHHRDIIGAAETGSGKTLAFGIPIIHHIMASKTHKEKSNDQSTEEILESETEESKKANGQHLKALIMTPTRELALQIRDHLALALKYTSIKVAAVVGGMASQKQQRMLKQHPEIVVATPGRLWEMIAADQEHVSDLRNLRYLVIDEADRMIEQGHYQELSSILDHIYLKKSEEMFDSCYPDDDKKAKQTPISARLQKFIFSATLTLPKSFKRRGQQKTISREEQLVTLMDKMNMEKKRSKVIDVTTKKGTVETLTEAKITCTKEDKDAYLYYFLLKYPGRTLIFTNTIDCIRRLASILRLLQLNPLPLHANMQQRQRLKNLDRFKSSNTGLLVATDVAARGLDIPKVQHVIHYQVSKDPEVYIHRSGRTARALNEGLSVVLVGPDDFASYRKIIKTLNSGEELEPFPIEAPYLSDVKSRISLARQIDKEENKIKKKKSSNDWFITTAKAMDIEVDEDLLEDIGDSRERKQQQTKLDQMKASLATMVKMPILPKGFSGKFPTMSGKLVIPGMQDEFLHEFHAAKAAVDKVKKKKKKKS